MSVIDDIHADALGRFDYVSDQVAHGVPEFWDRPTPGPDGRFSGDCEDFAIWCWHALRDAGLSPKLAVCRTEVCPAGVEFDHCVCLIDAAGAGWLVLDNRQEMVQPIDRLPYSGWMRQEGGIAAPWQSFTVG